jgi:hypothetical protein
MTQAAPLLPLPLSRSRGASGSESRYLSESLRRLARAIIQQANVNGFNTKFIGSVDQFRFGLKALDLSREREAG